MSPAQDLSREFLDRLTKILLTVRGFDLGAYKEALVRRRVASRLRSRRVESEAAYLKLLSEDPEEVQGLLDTLAINVSEFLRNPDFYEFLSERVLPELLRTRGGHSVRILSAGCSAGEEPYSLAILLEERFPAEARGGAFHLLGLDIDREALDRAHRGLYPPHALVGLPESSRRRWFESSAEGWRLKEEIRRRVHLRRADLLSDRLPGQIDLLLCRNVLIYFSRRDQDRLLARLVRAIAPGGFLALGRAEVLLGRAGAGADLASVDPRERVYRKSIGSPGGVGFVPAPREVHP